jgi:hypothetical protein
MGKGYTGFINVKEMQFSPGENHLSWPVIFTVISSAMKQARHVP